MSLNDLLVVTRSTTDYCIYNPFTRQLVALPPAPTNNGDAMCAFVLDCSCNIKSRIGCSNVFPVIRFRLLLMSRSSIHPRNDSIFDLSMYCSETRQWTKPINNVRLPFEIAGWQSWCCQAVVSNRVAYWLITDNNEVNGIVAFEPFKGIEHLQLWRVINMPIGFGRGQQTQKEFVRLGLVRGRLRMSQLSWVKDSTFALKVGELIYNNEDDNDDASHTSWILVHDLDVDMEKTGCKLSVIAFHPEIGDVIFVLRGFDICQYEIGGNKCEKVFEFSIPYDKYSHKKMLIERLSVLPLGRPSLGPTRIPDIPVLI